MDSAGAVNAVSSAIPWWGTSVLYSLCIAGAMLVNQQFNARPSAMMVWRGLGLATLAAPFLFFVTPPSNPKFYLLSFIMGCASAYYDNRIFTATSKFGAGIVSRVIPVAMTITFFGWFVFNPGDFGVLLETPLKFIGVIVCMLIAVAAIFIMKKNPISKDAILFLVIPVLLVAMLDVINKSAMVLIETKAVVYHICLASFVSGALNLLIYLRENKRIADGTKRITHPSMNDGIFTRRTMHAGICVVIVMFILMAAKGYSMQATPNPGYVSAIGYAAPLFILAFNKIKGVKDEASVTAGLVLVASIISMIVLVS
jgi:hypothetical protein